MPVGAPEPTLLTRAQVVQALARRGVKVNESDLRYWEYEGILPRPVRQWHEGAVRAVYPDWYPFLVRRIRALQRQGLSLSEIAPHIRIHARLWFGYDQTSRDLELRQHIPPWATVPEDIELTPDLVAALEKFARIHARFRGAPIGRMEVHVIGDDGRSTRYPLPIAPTASEERPTES